MKKLFLIAFLLFIIAGFFGYDYVMAAPKNIQTSKANFSLTTTSFSKEFSKNMQASEKKYTDQVVRIKGKITEIEENGVTIDDKVFCQLATTKNLKNGSIIEVKGLFIGYDELFELIKLDQGSVIK